MRGDDAVRVNISSYRADASLVIIVQFYEIEKNYKLLVNNFHDLYQPLFVLTTLENWNIYETKKT